MPRHVDDLRRDEPFPVKPDTNEYDALSFLVSNREYGFSPSEIAERTTVTEASATKTMDRLFEKGLVERAEGNYYVEPDRVEELEQRLDSLDAAARLFETGPDDDAYARDGWEDAVSSIDPDRQDSGETPETDAETLVSELADDGSGGRD